MFCGKWDNLLAYFSACENMQKDTENHDLKPHKIRPNIRLKFGSGSTEFYFQNSVSGSGLTEFKFENSVSGSGSTEFKFENSVSGSGSNEFQVENSVSGSGYQNINSFVP